MLAALNSSKIHTRQSLLKMACNSAPAGLACEFGVYDGASLKAIRGVRKPEVVGFDSWQGLPEAWDLGEMTRPAGDLCCTKPTDMPNGVTLVEGWYKDTIPAWLEEHDGEPIRLLHIDCDLYSSTKEVLEGVGHLLKAGSIIVFDELVDFSGARYSNWRHGEWKALLEFIEANESITLVPIGRTEHQQAAFIVKEG